MMNNYERKLFRSVIRALETDAARGRALASKLTTEDLTAFCLGCCWGAANGVKWLARINEEIFRAALLGLHPEYEQAAAKAIHFQEQMGGRVLKAVQHAVGSETAPSLEIDDVKATTVRGSAYEIRNLPH